MQQNIFQNKSKRNSISNNSNNYFNISENTFNETTIEESSITNLLKEIHDLEKKLSKLNSSKENSDNNIEPKIKKLSSLKNMKNNIENSITEIKNTLSIELKKNEISKEHKKVLLNELDQKIFEMKKDINLYNNNFTNFNCIELIKYIYINKIIENNDFLSKEQINNILEQKNNLSNNDEIKKILKSKEVNILSQNIIEKNILEKTNLQSQFEENLKMLDEEKNCLLIELGDILAYKETIEFNMKLCTDKIKNNFNKRDYLDDEDLKEPVDLLFDELINIDSEKAANKICDELYGLLILNKNKENINDKYFNLIQNKTFIINNESKNKRSDSYEYIQLNNNKNNYKYHKRSESSNASDSNIEDKKSSININTIKKDENEDLDKKMLKRLIKNEIDTFLNTHKISKDKNNYTNNQDFDKSLLNDFLFNLSMIIINKIKSILSKNVTNPNNFCISSNDIIIYLSLFFKLFHYENIFDNNNLFINKDYNLIKKELKKKIIEIEKEKIKLEDKLNEVKLKQKIDKALEQLILQKNKTNEESKCNDYFNLNKEETAYIDICKEYNDLIEQKEKIKNENEKNTNNLINKKRDIEIKIDEYNIQIEKINKEINDINKYIENHTLKNNEEIIKYRKIIADKFNRIKTELNSYKNKYHDDVDKYNTFIEKISNIMKSLNLNNSSLDNFYKNNNNDNNNIEYINDGSQNGAKSIIDYNYYNTKYNSNNKKIKNEYFTTNKEPYINIDIKKLNKSMTIIKNNNSNNLSLYENNYNNTNNSFLFKKQALNNSKNLDEETKSNFNLPIKQKKQNIYNIYNISLLPNVINKNKSTTNIHTKIKEIKKLKSTKKIPISNKLYNSKNFSSIFSESMQQSQITPTSKKSFQNSFSHNKSQINTNKNSSSKLSLLRNSIICYFRKISLEENKNAIKYNPLNNIDFDILCASPYNFIRAKMNLSDNYNVINIKIYKDKKILEIKLDEIENTVINSNIKKIIEIYRNYNKNKFKNNFSFEDFVNSEKNKFNEMSKEEIIKSALNQNFNFSLVIKKGERYEFIIRSYEEFKVWINGLAFIIKNKK